MLGCTCRIHLGIQWPRILCSRDYAQHQHEMIQGLYPILPIYVFMCLRDSCSTKMSQNSCSPELLAQHKYKYSCAPDLLSQHKSSVTHVPQRSFLNTNHQSLMYSRAPCSTQINNHSFALELPTHHKTSHQSCSSGSTPNTNKNIYIYHQ